MKLNVIQYVISDLSEPGGTLLVDPKLAAEKRWSIRRQHFLVIVAIVPAATLQRPRSSSQRGAARACPTTWWVTVTMVRTP